MKIGLAAYKFINNDITFNISQIEKAITHSMGANMICFGECFIQGFDSLTWNYENDKDIAIEQNSREINELECLSKKYNVDLAFGYIERENDKLYSSYMIIINGKKAYNYRRISKGWKEFSKTDYHYQEGSDVISFEYMNHQITIALCGDLWEYPQRFKCDGVLLWPVYVNYKAEEWEKYKEEYGEQASLVCERTLMVNSLSDFPLSCGNAFYFVNGEIHQSLSYDTEDVLIIEII